MQWFSNFYSTYTSKRTTSEGSPSLFSWSTWFPSTHMSHGGPRHQSSKLQLTVRAASLAVHYGFHEPGRYAVHPTTTRVPGGEPSTVRRPLSYIFHMILRFQPAINSRTRLEIRLGQWRLREHFGGWLGGGRRGKHWGPRFWDTPIHLRDIWFVSNTYFAYLTMF